MEPRALKTPMSQNHMYTVPDETSVRMWNGLVGWSLDIVCTPSVKLYAMG